MSASVAVAVNVTGLPAVPDLLPIGASTGATFTSLTVTVIVSKSLSAGEPLSVTRTVIGYGPEPGPCASVGVQVNAPPAVIAAPAGAPESSEKVSVCAGMSASVAVAVKLRSEPSLTVLLPIAARTGAVLVWSLIVIVIASVSFSGGVPLSVTVTVTGKEPAAGRGQLKA